MSGIEAMEDDLANISLINETITELIKMPEDSFVESKEEKVNTIVAAIKHSSDEAVHSVVDDIIKKERQRRFKFISKKKRSDLEYTNKIKMIELRVFVVKFMIFFVAILLLVTYIANLYFSYKAGTEPISIYKILEPLLGSFIDFGED